MGAVLAGALLAPLVLDRPTRRTGSSAIATMVTLGRWSYGLFVWHLAALAMVFPVIGEFAFNGHMPVVLVLTVVFGFAIAAVSYALIEIAVPSCVAALGVSPQQSRGSGAAAGQLRSRAGPSLPRDDVVAHRRPAGLARVVAQRGVGELDGARHLVAGDPLGRGTR